MGRFNKKFRLIAMIWMVAGFIPVEMIVGYVTNSTALIADSFHMLSDVVSLIIALLSVQVRSFVLIIGSYEFHIFLDPRLFINFCQSDHYQDTLYNF